MGWIGTGLCAGAAALSARKHWAYQGAGRLSVWLNAHIYLGTIAVAAILCHSSFRMGGVLTAWLLTFFTLTVVSGLLGMWLSRTVPRLLTRIEESPAIIEDLLSIRSDCIRGLLDLAAAGSAQFRAAVQGNLMKETGSWARMFRFYRRRSTLEMELPEFQRQQEGALLRLPKIERDSFKRAAEYALTLNKMNAELFLHRVLRGWMTWHAVSSVVMFGLVVAHIFSVLYY
jgi:hypothetical protein